MSIISTPSQNLPALRYHRLAFPRTGSQRTYGENNLIWLVFSIMPDFCGCRTQFRYPLHSLLGRCSGHRGHCLLAWQSILARKPRRHYPRRSKLFALDHRFIRASFGHGNSARQSGRFSTARLWAVELCIFGLLDRGHHGDHRCCLICLSGTGRK